MCFVALALNLFERGKIHFLINRELARGVRFFLHVRDFHFKYVDCMWSDLAREIEPFSVVPIASQQSPGISLDSIRDTRQGNKLAVINSTAIDSTARGLIGNIHRRTFNDESLSLKFRGA